MAAALTAAEAGGVLKELYPESKVLEEAYIDAPFFGMLEKDEEASGELYKIGLIYGHPQGRSATAANVYGGGAQLSSGKYAGFEVTYVDDYGAAQITGRAIDASRNDRGAFIRLMKQEMDGALHQILRSAHHAVYRNGGGALAQVASGEGTPTITLSRVEDIVFFEVGQVIEGDTTDGTSGAVHAGSVTITGIDRDLGTLTAAGNWTAGIAALAANDYLFVKGDFGLKMQGLDAWIPTSAPGATAFFGVDRSVDKVRLGGWRKDLSTLPVVEALIDGIEHGMRHGGRGKRTGFTHPKQIARVCKSLQSQGVYEMAVGKSEDGIVSYEGVKVRTPAGTVEMFGDVNCQHNKAWILTMSSLVLASMGSVPKMWDLDGNANLRTLTDGVELRTVYRANLASRAPGWNGQITLAS